MGPVHVSAVLAAAAALTVGALTAAATPADSAAASVAASPPDQRAALWQAGERARALSPAAHRAFGPQAGPASFVDNPDYYFYWREDDPPQDCFPNLYCEITQVDFYVPRDDQDSLVAIGYLDRPTNASLPTSANGGVAVYLETTGDRTWDYATLAPKVNFGLGTFYDWWMYYWDGSTWVRMNIPATWYRGSDFWGAIMPWRTLDITAAKLAVEVCDVNGQCDVAPGMGTPLIDITGAVDGLAPNAPSALTVTYRYQKKNKAIATLTWIYEGPGGPNSITNYAYRASGNGGKTWTAWKSTTSNRVTVTGLRKGQRGFFEVKAQNRNGFGPAARIALRP